MHGTYNSPEGVRMAVSMTLRKDFDAARLRKLAKEPENGSQVRRLLALAEIYDGGTRKEAARIGGVDSQTVRQWVLRFNSRGPEGLLDSSPPGRRSKLTDAHRRAIIGWIEDRDRALPWRLSDLSHWVFMEFHIAVAKQTLCRELQAMGYRKRKKRRSTKSLAEPTSETCRQNPDRCL
jgi:putative transposase